MLLSTTPFKGSSRHATFANVLRQEPKFPQMPAISTVGKSCIRQLLCKNEHKRLGSQSGASEVKNHKWFAPIVWGLLRHSKPPIVPAASVRSLTLTIPSSANCKVVERHRCYQLSLAARIEIARLGQPNSCGCWLACCQDAWWWRRARPEPRG